MAVERTRWTDDRLDQLAERVMRQDVLEARFDGLDRRMDSLERRMSEFQLEMRELRGDVNALRGELYSTKRWMMGLWLSGALGFAALFVQIALQN
jgi:hypothetical protein